jgi:hypothetical protein
MEMGMLYALTNSSLPAVCCHFIFSITINS